LLLGFFFKEFHTPLVTLKRAAFKSRINSKEKDSSRNGRG